ncbi:hypothetical protein Tco_0642207, partial [Tanacetum coccineum]
LIQMIKIHTDQNVANLLTKAFDVDRFQYLIASIGMLNLLTNYEIQVSVVGLTFYWHAWNEFSNTMASAVIYLATNPKFNFSKYIFDNMVKNLEGGVKFLMYPRWMQPKRGGKLDKIDADAEGSSRCKREISTSKKILYQQQDSNATTKILDAEFDLTSCDRP